MNANPSLRRDNPFTEHTAGAYFVGRENEVGQFRADLGGLALGNPNHAFVAGLHGTGKSSYLEHLTSIASEEGFLPALTVIDEGGPALSQIKTILRALAAAIQTWGATNGETLKLADAWDGKGTAASFQQAGLDELNTDAVKQDLAEMWRVAREHASGLVLCIDEGQWLHPRALSALKNAVRGQERLLVVMSLRLPTAEGGEAQAGKALLDAKAAEAGGDIGGSRMFGTEIGMGAFASLAEAIECIDTRLADNVMSFDADLSRELAELANRVPWTVISYAHKVYEAASGRGQHTASPELLTEVVRTHHASEVDLAVTLVSTLSAATRRMLVALVAAGGRATERQIAYRLGGGDDQDTLAILQQGIVGELTTVCVTFDGVERVDDHYVVVSPVYLHALRLALEER